MANQTESILSVTEAEYINDNFNDPQDILKDEYDENGMILTINFNNNMYKLFYDHETWFTGIAYQIFD